MRVGTYQFAVTHGDKRQNLERVAEATRDASLDLLVLPELFTTGLLFAHPGEVRELAETIPDGPTCRTLREIAENLGGVVVGSILEESTGVVYNTAVAIGPRGLVGRHRKVHLPDDEVGWFQPGEDMGVITLGAVRVGILICFECWVPEAARSLALQGAQIIAQPSNVVRETALQVIAVRAMENGVFWVSGDRTGTESVSGVAYRFLGESRVLDPEGRVLAASHGRDELLMAEIDPDVAHPVQIAASSHLRQELLRYNNS